jgi:hypothetical protein
MFEEMENDLEYPQEMKIKQTENDLEYLQEMKIKQTEKQVLRQRSKLYQRYVLFFLWDLFTNFKCLYLSIF